MDLDRLDTLARSVAAGGSRRRLLGLLATAPVVGGLLAAFDEEDAAAKDRRRRRKQRHKRRKDHGSRKGHKGHKGKKKGKGDGDAACQPEAATTCAGKCGEIVDPCGIAVDCGPCREALTCAACAALDDLDDYDREADCCGDLVCDCGQIVFYPHGRVVQCKRPGVCRPNRAPVALDIEVEFPWKMGFYAIDLNGYDPDFESYQTYRIVTFPQWGSLNVYNEVFAGEPGDAALPAPPLPPGTPTDCYPRCLWNSSCPERNVCPDCVGRECPEGPYWSEHVEYIPHSSTFAGTDSFTYAAVDVFGAEGPPATVMITIFET